MRIQTHCVSTAHTQSITSCHPVSAPRSDCTHSSCHHGFHSNHTSSTFTFLFVSLRPPRPSLPKCASTSIVSPLLTRSPWRHATQCQLPTVTVHTAAVYSHCHHGFHSNHTYSTFTFLFVFLAATLTLSPPVSAPRSDCTHSSCHHGFHSNHMYSTFTFLSASLRPPRPSLPQCQLPAVTQHNSCHHGFHPDPLSPSVSSPQWLNTAAITMVTTPTLSPPVSAPRSDSTQQLSPWFPPGPSLPQCQLPAVTQHSSCHHGFHPDPLSPSVSSPQWLNTTAVTMVSTRTLSPPVSAPRSDSTQQLSPWFPPGPSLPQCQLPAVTQHNSCHHGFHPDPLSPSAHPDPLCLHCSRAVHYLMPPSVSSLQWLYTQQLSPWFPPRPSLPQCQLPTVTQHNSCHHGFHPDPLSLSVSSPQWLNTTAVTMVSTLTLSPPVSAPRSDSTQQLSPWFPPRPSLPQCQLPAVTLHNSRHHGFHPDPLSPSVSSPQWLYTQQLSPWFPPRPSLPQCQLPAVTQHNSCHHGFHPDPLSPSAHPDPLCLHCSRAVHYLMPPSVSSLQWLYTQQLSPWFPPRPSLPQCQLPTVTQHNSCHHGFHPDPLSLSVSSPQWLYTTAVTMVSTPTLSPPVSAPRSDSTHSSCHHGFHSKPHILYLHFPASLRPPRPSLYCNHPDPLSTAATPTLSLLQPPRPSLYCSHPDPLSTAASPTLSLLQPPRPSLYCSHPDPLSTAASPTLSLLQPPRPSLPQCQLPAVTLHTTAVTMVSIQTTHTLPSLSCLFTCGHPGPLSPSVSSPHWLYTQQLSPWFPFQPHALYLHFSVCLPAATPTPSPQVRIQTHCLHCLSFCGRLPQRVTCACQRTHARTHARKYTFVCECE